MELRDLILQETTAGWNTPRGSGPVDPVAGFRGKKPGGSVAEPGLAHAKTQIDPGRAQETASSPRTHPQLIQAVRELITTVKGVQDPRAIETLFRIVKAATENIKTLKNKQGSGFGQGLAKAVASSPPPGSTGSS